MYSRNIRLLSIFNFLIGFNLFWPIAIIYFSRVSGSFTLGASILGIIMLASTVFELPTGILSDMVGRKYTIVLGSWARVLAFLFYAIGLSYWFLVIGAIFEGLSRAFYSGNNDAFLYDTLADENLESEFHEFQGKVSSTEQLAMGISAILGGIIANFSFSWALWISVLPQIGMLFVSYKFINPKLRKALDTNIFSHIKEATLLFIKNKKLRLLSLASVISFSISELKWGFTSAFIATVWPVWAIGIPQTISSFGASLSFFFSGKLIKKFKEINILLFDSIYGKVISLISLGYPSVFSPLLMSTPSFLFGVGNVAEKTLMQKEFTSHQRATMASLNSFAGSLGYAGMSLVLGGLADRMGPAKALFILTLIGLPTVYLRWIMFRDDRKATIIASDGLSSSL
jgi:MFS family permease